MVNPFRSSLSAGSTSVRTWSLTLDDGDLNTAKVPITLVQQFSLT